MHGEYKWQRLAGTVAKWDVLPYVENECSKLYERERHDHPKLRELRETFKLDEVGPVSTVELNVAP